jgi:hypothetical protein
MHSLTCSIVGTTKPSSAYYCCCCCCGCGGFFRCATPTTVPLAPRPRQTWLQGVDLPQTTYFADGPRTSEMFHMNNPARFNTSITPTKHHPSNGKRLDNYAGKHTLWPTRTVPSETLAELARAFTFLMHWTRYWKHPHFRLKRHSRMKPRVTQHGKGTLSPAYKTPCEQK